MWNQTKGDKRSAAGPSHSARACADTSLVAQGARVCGDVHFAGTLHLDGCVEGAVRAEAGTEGTFTLSEHGRVIGEIRVPRAVINGHVKGDIHVYDRLELAAEARIEGDVHYRVLEMAAGAQINGRMVHETETPRQLSAPQAVNVPAEEAELAHEA
ncbi:polymer-forming cytoskeletal protein [Oleiagrimonas sp. C23AA]|uniref:bactofilin family protein n=1 Tax=Oleiagrimonas sp. C23AA TaxID=2719047 RepID=UPI00141E2924|nr:polymer-forming cytoskeletal protein [Oleiagrimonas sp. C23AA]NII10843.1 polymer-forming cytoskeletal protein [Oleiagrimonas sp. C23AA]